MLRSHGCVEAAFELFTDNASLMVMKIGSILLINLAWITFAHAETVYKTVDDEGNTVFSDSQAEGAEAIEIKEAQTINIPETKSFEYAPAKEKQEDFQYTRLVISSPENESTIHSNQGNVNIGVEIMPALNELDQIVLFMDGKQVATGKTATFSLTNIDRGAHTVDVAVMNENDKLLKRSGKVEFYVRRASKLFPNQTPDPDADSPVNSPNPAETPQNSDSTPSAPSIPLL
jgi:Domain of unknown function (DUF4124)